MLLLRYYFKIESIKLILLFPNIISRLVSHLFDIISSAICHFYIFEIHSLSIDYIRSYNIEKDKVSLKHVTCYFPAWISP